MDITVGTVLARNLLFRGLSPTTLEQISHLCIRRSYPRDAVIFSQSDPGDALFGVVTGRVRISASSAGGREVFLRLELHEAATSFFEDQLRAPEGAVAREYLAGRGLTPEGIKTFRIGYAPDSFNALRDRLSPMADDEILRASGLFSAKEQGDGTMGHIYDRFRKRVMFPIANESGRVIAFTARTLET